jgi:signal peptidase I
MKQIFLVIWETVEVAIISLAVVLVIRTFLVQPFFVEGLSMAPNFNDGDYLIIDELTYRFRNPERGEVIVFRFPKNEKNFFIKRVIGLPGDTIKIQDEQVMVINDTYPDGLVLEEGYLQDLRTQGDLEIKLSSKEYFVLGDNRSMSYDSRSWGILPENNIVGLVRLRVWPISSAQAFSVPEYKLINE